jgi:hypothetical protein
VAFAAAVDMRKALRFCRERANNGSNFTAVLVADFEAWQVSPLIDEAAHVRKAAVEHNGGDSQTNGYWASELAWHSLIGWSLESIGQHADEATKVSTELLRSACARFLTDGASSV